MYLRECNVVTLHRGTAKKERKAIYIRQYAVIVCMAERAEPWR